MNDILQLKMCDILLIYGLNIDFDVSQGNYFTVLYTGTQYTVLNPNLKYLLAIFYQL